MIITSITNLTVKQIDPFFRTLRSHYDGTLVVMAGIVSVPVLEYLKRNRAIVMFAGQLNVNNYHWNNFRFLFLQHLIENAALVEMTHK